MSDDWKNISKCNNSNPVSKDGFYRGRDWAIFFARPKEFSALEAAFAGELKLPLRDRFNWSEMVTERDFATIFGDAPAEQVIAILWSGRDGSYSREDYESFWERVIDEAADGISLEFIRGFVEGALSTNEEWCR
jgi:hypothetical protein